MKTKEEVNYLEETDPIFEEEHCEYCSYYSASACHFFGELWGLGICDLFEHWNTLAGRSEENR